ncbi:MAG: hypothetical protein WAL56_23210 [Candidatus Sulfotelmatobacter sp.]
MTISANPTSIPTGSSTTLTVIATNATQVVLTDSVGDPAYTFTAATGGTDVVSPTANVTYTATATGASGATATNMVSVTVNGPAPTMTTFSANPPAILAGASLNLNWTSSSNTAYVVINTSVGPSPGRVAANSPVPNGFSVPSPTQTTTYTAVATDQSGQQSAPLTTKVTVDAITSFAGMAEDSTNQGETDIDPNGAVGTKQFLEYVNTEYQGYDKNPPYTPVWSTPQSIGTPWIGQPHCEDPKIQLDAVIIFDHLASRWVIGAKTTVQQEYYFCIAVSNTDDLTSPTFAWYPYFFKLDAYLTAGTLLPDWPKLGTWWNAYYAAMDTVDVSQQAEVGAVICAFNRTTMLTGAGVPNAPGQCVQITGPLSDGVYLAHSLIPADVDGTTPPPTGRDEFMASIENPSLVGNPLPTTSTTINLWDVHAPDWSTNPLTYTLSSITVPTYTPGCYLFDPDSPAITNCVPEPGITGVGAQKVDSVGDRFMPRFAYRNFASASVPYESFLISSTVQTGLGVGQNSTQTGILWYELRGSVTPSVFQQGLISPDSNYFRFLPSIAQDHVGNAAVGYSISNTFTDPGISASVWNLPSSTAPTEVTIINGADEGEEVTPETPPQNGNGQWGSYAGISVDPVDDCTFWYVNEYWPVGNAAWATNIAYFQIPGCSE